MTGEARLRVRSGDQTVDLDLPWETTVGEALTQARELLPAAGEDGEPFCSDGTTLHNKLRRTLAELRERRICPRLEFELRPPPPGS